MKSSHPVGLSVTLRIDRPSNLELVLLEQWWKYYFSYHLDTYILGSQGKMCVFIFKNHENFSNIGEAFPFTHILPSEKSHQI